MGSPSRRLLGLINTFTFTRDDEGNLTLEAVEPMDPGDCILMTTKTWTKID